VVAGRGYLPADELFRSVLGATEPPLPKGQGLRLGVVSVRGGECSAGRIPVGVSCWIRAGAPPVAGNRQDLEQCAACFPMLGRSRCGLSPFL